MKKIIPEFRTFIMRGNVVDMSVGVIVGGAFTAIVNGMGNFIFKPMINALLALIFGANSLSDLHTYLRKAYILDELGHETAEIDLANSIYIDWGSFINAVINFLITAFVLFMIVKIINKLRENREEITKKVKLSRKQRKEMKARGINKRDKEAVAAYLAEQRRLAEEAAEAEKAAAEEAEKRAREENPTEVDMLKLILEELKKDNG